MASQPASRVPPGFRFHPTDEELVNYYLRKKVNFEKFDLDVIRDVDLNKLEPWDLHERCRIDTAQQTEWYFFSHKDKKYPTGTRTNRATAAGFWKATGRDKAVHTIIAAPSHSTHTSAGHVSKRIGMRKTLVFYRGRAPHGQKTDWIMHEYRLEDGPSSHDLSSNEDGWVVCRVFKKRIHHQKPNTQPASHQSTVVTSEEEQSSLVENNSNNYHEHYKNFQMKSGPFSASNCLKFSCKQEEDYEDNMPQVPFLHMPALESPKNTIHDSMLFSELADYHSKRSLLSAPEASCFKREDGFSSQASCFKREDGFSSPFALVEMPTLDTAHYTKSLIFGGDQDNLNMDSYGEENDEWGVLESLPKDMRYHHLSSNNLCNTILSSNCDLDIWKPLL